ncbi:MAG TPA: nucleotide exchange factor GrpE [Balneola sp.]|jgi:molecular chaperone GrpE|nr:nucleotide exchange factor GrpE [Balneola sp.]MAO78489.1 nucleotide exchange factor GrpE [Balneola sp.]MBF64854.1 nucleotide exchange factor GrpE [Balneola sp.]HAH49865.1 nucleotide exchange factor GrpE [Balneola sp.]HAW80756.1 nucleotide exchange factor GrpE [Balneola sp.]|tara:strand:- start:4705 stop:5286 length:582 start_codon:yes stop_codon:yes gene_type:complete
MSKKEHEEILEDSEKEVLEEDQAESSKNISSEDSNEEVKDEKELRIEELEAEIAVVKDTMLRKAAELENVRKRVQKERYQLREQVKAEAMQDFLPLNDDLLRTLDASKDSSVDENFLAGVEMVSQKFAEILAKHGIEKIDDTGVPFDVNLHDALLRQPATDEKTPSDTVLQVLERGYRMGEKVIKHAKVIVSQ